MKGELIASSPLEMHDFLHFLVLKFRLRLTHTLKLLKSDWLRGRSGFVA